jgi:hypothetical protein
MSQAGILSVSGNIPPIVIETLTGNTGGAVGPTGHNINVIGSGTISVAGNPGTSTLTISASGSVSTSFVTNSGTATPSAGILNVLGGTNISTTGSGNTVTINASSVVVIPSYTLVNTSPYVATGTDYYLAVDSSGGAITIDLPNAPTNYRSFIIKDKTGSAATHNITITTVGGVVTIDGSTSFILNTAYESATILFDGANYQVF